MTEDYDGPERRELSGRLRRLIQHLSDQLDIISEELALVKEESKQYLDEPD